MYKHNLHINKTTRNKKKIKRNLHHHHTRMMLRVVDKGPEDRGSETVVEKATVLRLECRASRQKTGPDQVTEKLINAMAGHKLKAYLTLISPRKSHSNFKHQLHGAPRQRETPSSQPHWKPPPTCEMCPREASSSASASASAEFPLDAQFAQLL